jgi:hypothetical protein
LIFAVATPAYGRVEITADGKRYSADLSHFRTITCFPRTVEEWRRVSIDSYGLVLVWASRFEVHADQVIGLADKVTRATAAA